MNQQPVHELSRPLERARELEEKTKKKGASMSSVLILKDENAKPKGAIKTAFGKSSESSNKPNKG